MLGINPIQGGKLVWKLVQYHADGNQEQFTGSEGSPRSPTVTLKPAPGVTPAGAVK